MAGFTSASPVVDGLIAGLGVSKSSTLVQFAIGACMLFIRHLVQRLDGFVGIETGRALMIANLVPALEGLLTAFGGVRLGIGSTPPILLLNSSHRRQLPTIDRLASPGFHLWKATEGSPGAHSVFDHREETAMVMAFVSGWMVLTVLAGAWIILARISVTKTTTDAGGSPLIPNKNWSSADEGSKTVAGNGDGARVRLRGDPAGHRNAEPHGDERKHDRASDSDDDSEDEDPPPPPGPGTDLRHDDDEGENMGWKHLGVNFMLGYLVLAMLKGLRRLKTKGGAQGPHNDFGIDEQIGGTDYGKEWDVLEGTYGFSHSKSMALRARAAANGPRTTKPLAEDFRLTVRAVQFNKVFPSATSYAAAQNQSIPAFFSASRQMINWEGMNKIKTTIEKAMSKVDLAQSIVVIQICLEKVLEMFGLDFAVLVVMPLTLITAVLRYRYDEQGDGADGGAEEHHQHDLTEANERGQGEAPKRREDDEDFVYLDQRYSVPPNVLANGNNSEQIDISTPLSSPRRRMERCSTHYSDLAEFISRHACKPEDLDPTSENDVCVSITEGRGNPEAANVKLAYFTSNYAYKTVTEPTSFGGGDTGEEHRATDTGWSSGDDLDIAGEFEDPEEELSDAESYVTAEGDLEMEVTMKIHDKKMEGKTNGQEAEIESLCEPFSEQDSVLYIDDSSTEDESGGPTRSFPGSFPVMLGQIPLWGSRSNRWSIFAQFEELREGGPLLASEANDFGLPRSNSSFVERQASVKIDSFRTPPQAKTLPSTPPAVPRGRKMRLKEKEMREGSNGTASLFLGLVEPVVGVHA